MKQAKTHHVYNFKSVSMIVSLNYQVLTTLTINLKGVAEIVCADNDEREKITDTAKYCLIILLGGKSLLLDIPENDNRNLEGVFYLRGYNKDYPHFFELIGDNYYLNINKYMQDMSVGGYDSNAVKLFMRGMKKKIADE